MYSENDVRYLFDKEQNPKTKFFILSHSFIPIILEKDLDSTSEEEYFEALIFSSTVLFETFQVTNNEEKTENLTVLIHQLSIYLSETEGLSDFLIENDNLQMFLLNRIKTVIAEINRVIYNENYLALKLLYNLYYNPLNNYNFEDNELMIKMSDDYLIKNFIFRTKFNSFLKAIQNAVKLI